MKKQRIRWSCLFMATFLAIAFTNVGCRKSTDIGTSGTKSSESSKTSVDFGGATIKVAIWYEPEIPQLGKSESEDAWYYSLENAKNEFNCDVEWVVNPQDTHFSKFVQSSLSGEVYADIIMNHSWNYISLIKQGLICPTDEYIDSSSEAKYWEKDLYTYMGKCWALQPASLYSVPSSILIYNTKILNELGLESPQTLALNGTWTWDKFREYCKAATNAGLERYGAACFMLPDVLQSADNFKVVTVDESTGLYTNGFTYSGTKQAGLELLELMENMSQEDKSILGEWCEGQSAMDDAQQAFVNGKVLFSYGGLCDKVKKQNMTDFAPVTAPIGPSGTELTDGVSAFAFWSLPMESDYSAADRAAFWMEAKSTWNPDEGDGYYAGDVDTYKENLLSVSYCNMNDVEFLLKMGEGLKKTPLLDGTISLGAIVADTMFGSVIRGESTPAAVIEETNNAIQAKIDTTLNKD